MLADVAFQEFTASVKAASFSSQQIQLTKNFGGRAQAATAFHDL
ncbi:MAG: hypothetical protein R3C28_17105 [Pirellulaceae bacterium]